MKGSRLSAAGLQLGFLYIHVHITGFHTFGWGGGETFWGIFLGGMP